MNKVENGQNLHDIFDLLPTRQQVQAQLKNCQSTHSTLSLKELEFLVNYTLTNTFYNETSFFLNCFVEKANFKETFKLLNSCGFLKKNDYKEKPIELCNILLQIFIKISKSEKKYECEVFMILEIVSLIVTTHKIYSDKNVIGEHFKILSALFLKSEYFYSYLNCLRYLKELNLEIEMSFEGVSKILEISKIKNEEQIFKKYFCGLEMIPVEEFKGMFNKSDCNQSISLDEKWNNFSVEMINSLENRNFLKLKGFEFEENEKLKILGHKFKSITIKLFELKTRFENVVKVEGKDDMWKRERERLKENLEKFGVTEKKHKKTVKLVKRKKDYFTKQFNLFRLCKREMMKRKDLIQFGDDECAKRLKKYDAHFETVFNDQKKRKEELLKIKDLVESGVNFIKNRIEEERKRQIEREKEEEEEFKDIVEKPIRWRKTTEDVIQEDDFKVYSKEWRSKNTNENEVSVEVNEKWRKESVVNDEIVIEKEMNRNVDGKWRSEKVVDEEKSRNDDEKWRNETVVEKDVNEKWRNETVVEKDVNEKWRSEKANMEEKRRNDDGRWRSEQVNMEESKQLNNPDNFKRSRNREVVNTNLVVEEKKKIFFNKEKKIVIQRKSNDEADKKKEDVFTRNKFEGRGMRK